MAVESGDTIFQTLLDTVTRQQELIASIANKLQQIESIGGGGGGTGNASIADYESGQNYERNTLLVDTSTETVYRVIDAYTSISVETDCANGHLKLVGFESQIVTVNGNPTQQQINVLPEDTLVALYSSSSTPYQP